MTGQLFCTWRRHIHMYTIVLCRHVLCIYVLLLADIHITSMMGTENKQDVTAKIHPQVSDVARADSQHLQPREFLHTASPYL